VPVATLAEVECLGELALSGKLRPVQGVLPAALAAREAGRALVVPRENAEEASLGRAGGVCGGPPAGAGRPPERPGAAAAVCANGLILQQRPYPDLSEVQGQLAAKRALLLAAAGAHNLLFTGPPGTGKTLLASRLPGLLPPLDEHEALEVAAIQSVSGHAPLNSWPQRPFRHPITPPPARRWSVAAAAATRRNHPGPSRRAVSR
jgi:magnesium chelatase family protein